MDKSNLLLIILLLGALVSAIFMLTEGVASVDEEEYNDFDAYKGETPKYTIHEQRRNFAYQSAVVILLICLIFVTYSKN